METVNRRYVWLFFGILIVIMVGAYVFNIFKAPVLKSPIPLRSDSAEISSYYVVKDPQGVTIFQTGLPVSVDDQYIDEHDVQYVVIKVDGQSAVADKASNSESASASLSTVASIPPANVAIPVDAAPNRHVVIYHTHSDESYTPSSGKPSQPGAGDVFTIGDVLTDSLQKSGVSVTHSLATHDPHDINAYNRSRKTLVQLLKEQPDAAFDVHRDSAPASAYITSINGVDTSKVMMVVGRSNPTEKVNLN
jgi:stage II sporulation protein P